MEEQKKSNDIEEAASALIANAEKENTADQPEIEQKKAKVTEEENDKKIFKKYKIKDIVFLAIITACTLVTGAVMPLLVNVPLFGIVQLGLGLQFSIFPVIGLMKVRKPGALFLQSVFISAFLIFMFPPMALLTVCALIAEGVALLPFRGYQNDWACVVAGTLYLPMTIPFLYFYYRFFYTVTEEGKTGMSIFLAGYNSWVVAGISCAIVVLCFVGSLIGMVIARELKKAGVLKK